jgi:hypothetical protein
VIQLSDDMALDFWAFPSAAGAQVSYGVHCDHQANSQQKQNALSKAESELESVKAKIEECKSGLIDAEKGREDTVCAPYISGRI